MAGYRNPDHCIAFERAQAIAAALPLEELHNEKALEKIVSEVQRGNGMYQKRALCRRMAEQAIQIEVRKRNRG